MKILYLLLIAVTLDAQTTLENYACNVPSSISNANPAVVTCPSPHGWNKWASDTWNFGGLPANNATITIDGTVYTFVTSINNSVANEVLIGALPIGNVAAAFMHAINDDGVGKGTLYSNATTANPTWSGAIIDNLVYGYVTIYARVAGPAYIGHAVSATTTPNANGAWTSSTTIMTWGIVVSGSPSGGWAGIGTTAAPRVLYARYVSATQYSLYTSSTATYNSTSNGAYVPGSVTIQPTGGGGSGYPYAYNGESWSITGAVTPDPYFSVNVPACTNTAHEQECALAYRIPEVSKYAGNHTTISSFVVASGVATITLATTFPYNSGYAPNMVPGQLLWIRNISDPAGAWTHTSSLANATATSTVTNHLVKYVPGTNTVAPITTDRGGAIGVCQSGCGNSGTAVIADGGLVTCTFDNATTAGHWISVNTYDDRCHDVSANFGDGTQALGVVQDTGAAGNHSVWLAGLNRAFTAQTVNGSGGGVGVTVITVNVPGYPDGTYSFATLPGYTFPQTTPFVDTNKTVSPYVYQVSQTGGGYSYPAATTQAMARDQSAWSPTINRIEFWVKWGKNQKWCGSEDGTEFGTYLIPPGYAQLSGHGYHQMDYSTYSGQWQKMAWINGPTHQEGISDTNFNYAVDPDVVGGPYIHQALLPLRGYYQRMASFYYDMHGYGCGNGGDATGQTLYLSPQTYYTATNEEPDELVNTRSGVWTPSLFLSGDPVGSPSGPQGYELDWFGTRNLAITYEVRYSTAGSMKTLGFSSGLCQNGTTTCSSADRVSANMTDGRMSYQSGSMPQQPNIWWAIRPVSVPVASTTGSGQQPTWIVTPVDLKLSAGDHVTISGVTGNTAANQTNIPVSAAVTWTPWYATDPQPAWTGGLAWSNLGSLVQVAYTNHGFSTGQLVQFASLTTGSVSGRYTVTVVDPSHFTLDGSSYTSLCPCTGGSMREINPAQLVNIVSNGAVCTATLTVPHNLVPGWKIYVFGSTDNVKLTPGPSGGVAAYTVASTPDPTHLTFACTATAGTYALDTPQTSFGIQAWPAVSLNVTGNGAYSGGGTIYSTEDTRGFAEINLSAFVPMVPERTGGRVGSTFVVLSYRSPDAGPCTASLGGAAAIPDSGGLRARTLVFPGLSAGASYVVTLTCAGGASVTTAAFSTPFAETPSSGPVQLTAAAPWGASAVANLVVDYGDSAAALNQSVNSPCSYGVRCAASFPHPVDSLVWVRRRWCTNLAGDPLCTDPSHELARSVPQAISLR